MKFNQMEEPLKNIKLKLKEAREEAKAETLDESEEPENKDKPED